MVSVIDARARAARLSSAPAPVEILDSDIANGKRLVARHGADLRFTPERGWLVFDGRRWAVDEKGIAVQALAKETAVSIFDDIKDAPDRASLMKHATRSQSKRSIEAMIWLARSEPGISARWTEFDTDGWVLNVANGTLDLHTGQLRAHAREDLISNLVDIPFDPAAEAELWDQFLWRVLDRNDELYAYVRRFAGYLLAADTSDQSLHFLYGPGANGKSSFCEILMRLMGDYAIAASPEMIMVRRQGSIPNDVARLCGKRAAFMNETTQGTRLDESKVKDLTGGDTQTARFMRHEWFDFPPTHRLIVRGNHKPTITGTDEGIWRRVKIVPFTVEIPPQDRDRGLLQKLVLELPGILNWALQGCREWQEIGLSPPPIVTAAVSQYREDSDTLGRFVAECCEVLPMHKAPAGELYERYQKFCERAGEPWLASKFFPADMQRLGFERERKSKGSFYVGLK
jgi:putative DNA primase/helicase